MPKLRLFMIICMSLLLVFVYGCNKGSDEGESVEASTHEQEQEGQAGEGEHGEKAGEGERGEHAGEGERGEHAGERERGEHAGEGERGEHAGEGEETGPRISLDGTHDEVRKGVRLILSFDNESSSFIGTVENVTEKTVSRVRVEVHLSNGVELGPTKPINLAPGKKVDVKLSAEGQSFKWWKSHAEAGASEHR
jgi:predicted DNA-binding antitoxin AbrB/MazE fold protein